LFVCFPILKWQVLIIDINRNALSLIRVILLIILVVWLITVLLMSLTTLVTCIKKFNVINYHLCHKDRFAVLTLKGACLDTACNTNLRAFPAILCCVFSRFAPYLAANEIRILIALMIPEGPVYRQ